jgi:uncharacterized protein (DUF486 family)
MVWGTSAGIVDTGRRCGQPIAGAASMPPIFATSNPELFMQISPAAFVPIVMLCCSNVFMTFAWYGQLKFPATTLWVAIVASWGIAFFEYCLAVPANRIGYGTYSGAELKAMQEVISITAFVLFAIFVLGEKLTLNHFVGFGLIGAGAFFIFKGPFA